MVFASLHAPTTDSIVHARWLDCTLGYILSRSDTMNVRVVQLKRLHGIIFSAAQRFGCVTFARCNGSLLINDYTELLNLRRTANVSVLKVGDSPSTVTCPLAERETVERPLLPKPLLKPLPWRQVFFFFFRGDRRTLRVAAGASAGMKGEKERGRGGRNPG